MVIKLANLPGNTQMLKGISATIGGYVSIVGGEAYRGKNKNKLPLSLQAKLATLAPASAPVSAPFPIASGRRKGLLRGGCSILLASPPGSKARGVCYMKDR